MDCYACYTVLVTILGLMAIFYLNMVNIEEDNIFETIDNNKDIFESHNIEKKWRLLLDTNDINNAVDKCADYINYNFKDKNVIIVGILKGAVYFFVDLTRRLEIPHSCHFIETTNDSQSDHSIIKYIDPTIFKDKHVILIDELFDNGKTINNVKNIIHKNANVPLNMIFTCVAFKKNKMADYNEPDFYGSIVPNVWLVGYGLDDNQQKRNYINLWGVPKENYVCGSVDDQIFIDPSYYRNIRHALITH